jgi:WD40 repeat protein
MIRRLARLSLLGFALVSLAATLHAQGTQLWTESSYQGLEGGTPHGAAVASDGRLLPGPASKLLYTTPSTYVWSVAADKQGNAYLATGSPATVLRVTPDGKSTTLFTTKDLSVQAIAVGPHGSVYAATMPSGKVYKLAPDTPDQSAAKATVVFDSSKIKGNPRYIWALKFGPDGGLYIATGAPAAIYKVAPGGQPTLFYQSDEPHIRALAFAPNGDLIAGSDGSGLVYRISKSGKAYVIYDAPKKEITSLAVAPDGTIYAAGVGGKGKNTLPPLPASSGSGATVTATITIVTAGSVQAASSNTLIPDGTQIYEIAPSGAPRLLWSGHNDIVYALHWTKDGLIAASGNSGHIYRIQESGQFEDIAHLDASQATSLAVTRGGLYAATANAGKLYRLSNAEAPHSSYVSDVFDAGVFAQWGRAEVDTTTPSLVQLYARTGNVENPARAWSGWHAVSLNQGNLGVENSRFLQWKLVLEPGASVSSVGINYLPVNVAPVVDEVVIAPGVRVNAAAIEQQGPQQVTINFPSQEQNDASSASDAANGPLAGVVNRADITVRWRAHDGNGDTLVYSLYYRAPGEHNWMPLKRRTRRTWYTFPAALLPNGRYRVMVVASDAPSHNPGEALTGSRVSGQFLVDTAPPAVTDLRAQRDGNRLHVTFTATDPVSPVARAVFSLDAGRWQYIEPVGHISDNLTEHYDFYIPLPQNPPAPSAEITDPNEHLVTVRVHDRNGNAATASTLAH